MSPIRAFFDAAWALLMKHECAPSQYACVACDRAWDLFNAADAEYKAYQRAAEALRTFAEPGRDLTEHQCHLGICSVEECMRCSRVLEARAALAELDKVQR